MTPASFEAFKEKLAAANFAFAELEENTIEISVEVEGAQQSVRLAAVPQIPFVLVLSVTPVRTEGLDAVRLRAILSKAQAELFATLQARRVEQGEFFIAMAMIHEEAREIEFHERITGCARLASAVMKAAASQ